MHVHLLIQVRRCQVRGRTLTWSLDGLYKLTVEAEHSGGACADKADDMVVVVVDFVGGVTDGEIG